MVEIVKKVNDAQKIQDKKILRKIKEEFLNQFDINLSSFVNAVNEDFSKRRFKVSIEKIKTIISEENIIERQLNKNIIYEEYGTIFAIYNGNPYITVQLILKAINTGNKIVLCSKNNFKINSVIIENLKKVIRDNMENENIIGFCDSYYELNDCENMIDNVIFIGEKYEYLNLKKKTNLNIDFYGYGYISLFFDDEKFGEDITMIKVASSEQLMEVSLYKDDIENAINEINDIPLNDCTVIYSNNKKNIILWTSKIKSNKIFVNKNFINNYKLELRDDSFINKKEIII